jgi:hypothetical protein
MHTLTVTLLPGELAICRLAADAIMPTWADDGAFVSVTRTASELSVVCATERVPAGVTASSGWRLLRVEGPLPLDLIGIFVALGSPLAAAGVSIFPIATYDTDWLLVPGAQLTTAIDALRGAGHRVVVERSAHDPV